MAKTVSMDEKLIRDMALALRAIQYGILHYNIRQSQKDLVNDALRAYDAREEAKKKLDGNPQPPEPRTVTITLPKGVDVVTVTMETHGNLLVMDGEQAQMLGACPSSAHHYPLPECAEFHVHDSRCVK